MMSAMIVARSFTTASFCRLRLAFVVTASPSFFRHIALHMETKAGGKERMKGKVMNAMMEAKEEEDVPLRSSLLPPFLLGLSSPIEMFM